MNNTDEEYYCRIDGRVEGPLTARALKTRAALGELIPDDEVRRGIEGHWQPAKSVRGLQFSSTVRSITPIVEVESQEAAAHYRYKMVQIPPTIEISEKTPKSTAAARYLESLVTEQASEGWEFFRVDSIGVRVQSGCLMAIFGQSNISELYYVVTFRKLA